MPIYEYRCSACGHQKDHLQKMSDAALTVCPACGAETYVKQISAAGFQLKGSGWYATDFKSGGSNTSTGPARSMPPAKAAETPAVSSEPAKSADAPAAPAASCGGGCACH